MALHVIDIATRVPALCDAIEAQAARIAELEAVVAARIEAGDEIRKGFEAQAAEIANLKQHLNETCVEHIIDRDDARIKAGEQATEIERLRATLEIYATDGFYEIARTTTGDTLWSPALRDRGQCARRALGTLTPTEVAMDRKAETLAPTERPSGEIERP